MTTTEWRVRWRQRLALPGVELTIGGLIVISIILTTIEFALESAALPSRVGERGADGAAAPPVSPISPYYTLIVTTNECLTLLFVLELTLRALVASSFRTFLSQYWLDIIAVLPVFRVFRGIRVLRLLRLFRLLGLFSRYAKYYPYILRRGALEYLLLSGLILITVIFGTTLMLALEGPSNQEIRGFADAFWFSLYSMVAGEPIPTMPQTVGGKFVAAAIMFMGLTVFAVFTGMVSAFMIERLRHEGKVVDWEDINDHLIVCGWNRKAEILVREYHAATDNTQMVVVIAQPQTNGEMEEARRFPRVRLLVDDFAKVTALTKAGIHRARTCVILSDRTGSHSAHDTDARTILTALTVERLNPNVYTCAELIHGEYAPHLEMAKVNDYVISGEYSAFLLAHAALNRGLMGVVTELLTFERGNQFYRLALPSPSPWVGRGFLDLFIYLKQTSNAILVAVHVDNQCLVNPHQYIFQGHEDLVLIADHKVQL